jgi:two-component sensor histidine kinase/DNA-binding ferritin-like protein
MDYKSFFFPNSSEILLTLLCYTSIIFFAYKRYSALAEEYGKMDAPEAARPWTTWFRYHASAFIYFSIFVLLFAAFYNLFEQHPVLFKLFEDYLPQGFLEKLEHSSEIAAPIAAAFFLTLAIDKSKRLKQIDRDIRRSFQRLGSIPRCVSDMIEKMKNSTLKFDQEECTSHLDEKIQAEFMLPIRQNERKSFEHLYVRARHLHNIISHWNTKESVFFNFRTVFNRQYKTTERAYQRMEKLVERYLNEHQKIQSTTADYPENALSSEQKRLIVGYNKLIKEMKRDAKEAINELLNNIYTFMACAVFSEGMRDKSRQGYLTQFGFQDIKLKRTKTTLLDVHDFAILVLLLFFVIPVAAAFSSQFGGTALKSFTVFAVYGSMAIFAGLSSALSAIYVKKRVSQSEHFFWKSLRSDGEKRNRCGCYVLAGLIAAVIATFGLTAISYLQVSQPAAGLFVKIKQFAPWAFIPFALALTIALNLDLESENKNISRIRDTLICTVAGSVAAIIAYEIHIGTFNLSVLSNQGFLTFVLPAAILLSGISGAMVPHLVRKQASRNGALNKEPIDLQKLINQTVKEITRIADQEQIKIGLDIEPQLPPMEADKKCIRQAIRSLVLNAVDSTQRGGEISIKVRQGRKSQIDITVSDNGIGMDRDAMEKVNAEKLALSECGLETFDEDTTSNLKQVKSIAEGHKGGFSIESKRGEGTTTVIQFPSTAMASE